MVIATVHDFRRAIRHGVYAWPGGYPVYFICDDGEAMCFDCAKHSIRTQLELIVSRDRQRIYGSDVNWEDPSLTCVDCNAPIESAYCDPSEDAA